MNRHAVLEVLAEKANLAEVRDFVRHGCSVGGDGAESLDLIVEELFLNIALHACPGEMVRIGCGAECNLAEVEFLYGGPIFNPVTDAPAPDLAAPLGERPIGGLGVFLVMELADSVEYQRDGEVNRLAVRLRI